MRTSLYSLIYGTLLTFNKFTNFNTQDLNRPRHLFHSFCYTTWHMFEPKECQSKCKSGKAQTHSYDGHKTALTATYQRQLNVGGLGACSTGKIVHFYALNMLFRAIISAKFVRYTTTY